MRLRGIELAAEDGDIANVLALATGLADSVPATLLQMHSALKMQDRNVVGK
jgi:hypothetical protein